MFKKILIADDHSVVRLGASVAFQTNYNDIEIFVAENYFEVEKILIATNIELLILDIQMPGVDNSVIKEIKEISSSLKILLFSAFKGDIVLHFIKDGADGYLNKQCTSEQIIDAVKTLYHTGFVFPPDTTREILNLSDRINPKKVLSEREYQIFILFIQGMGNLEITNALSIQPGTVTTYKKRIFAKLNAKSIADLVKIQMDFNN